MEETTLTVVALYKFVDWPDYEVHQTPLRELCAQGDVMGTLLLANEGINGTIAGPESGVRAVVGYLQGELGNDDFEIKYSHATEAPFLRLKVRLKDEIVTLGQPGVDPRSQVGEYVEPEDWNALIEDPDTILVDTRNEYEIEVGAFQGAINPNTKSFREFPDYVRNELETHRDRKIAMYCTGGIRCEKATSYLLDQGFKHVYHLKGGVLNYLAKTPKEQSKWDGSLFVFDDRVALDHELNPNGYELCHACRFPLSPEDLESPDYEPGVCCPKCKERQSERNRERAAARQKQMELAKTRNEAHIGAAADALLKQKALEKGAP